MHSTNDMSANENERAEARSTISSLPGAPSEARSQAYMKLMERIREGIRKGRV